MKRLPAAVTLASGIAAALWPAAAFACSVCGEGTGRNHTAFFISTISLSLLPLGLLGSGVLWLARSGREFLATEFIESDESMPAPRVVAPAPLASLEFLPLAEPERAGS